MSTQWTAQFLVASELTRRDYTVAFTNGNHTPYADMMVGTPGGEQFWVDVKGVKGQNSWTVNDRDAHKTLFYVLVGLAPMPGMNELRKPDRFFILSQSTMRTLLSRYRADHPNDRWRRPGFNFNYPSEHEAAWHALPR